MTRFNVFACCLLALVTTSTRAESPNSNREKTASVEDFEKLQSQFAGRWIGELKVNVLWPKSGLKKGDVAVVYADFNVDLDGMTLAGERKLGHIKWKQTFHYDATKSAIITRTIDLIQSMLHSMCVHRWQLSYMRLDART